MVSDPEAARVLSQARFAAYLAPFMRGPTTQREASEILGTKLNALHHWVRRFEAFGLLRVVEVKARAGRAIRVYEAVAREFVIPVHLVPPRHFEASEAAWLGQFRGALEGAAPELTYAGGLHLSLTEDGGLNLDRTTWQNAHFDPLAEAAPAVLLTWSGGLELTHEEAKGLQRELWMVFERYRRKARQPNGQRYLLSLGLAPATRD